MIELGKEFEMRRPCVCGSTTGHIIKTNGQNVVRCSACDRHCYNAPKSETGEPQATVRTRPNFKPSQKARILMRDQNTCAVCHSDKNPLHVGHIISVDDGLELGMTEEELYSDLNLVATCDECNLGQGRRSAGLQFQYRLFRIWQKYGQA